MQDDARVVALQEPHLAGCLRLSQSANWNQNEADWRLMLGFGRGWGFITPDGTLAASTVALPYGAGFAWIAMVLVLPEHRRQGYASRLLRVALAEMEKQKRVSLLDATPAAAPGGPGVVIGHNDRIAWGMTNVGPDVQDLYEEKFDPSNPKRYLTPVGWRVLDVRHEEIKVRKGFIDSATDTVALWTQPN